MLSWHQFCPPGGAVALYTTPTQTQKWRQRSESVPGIFNLSPSAKSRQLWDPGPWTSQLLGASKGGRPSSLVRPLPDNFCPPAAEGRAAAEHRTGRCSGCVRICSRVAPVFKRDVNPSRGFSFLPLLFKQPVYQKQNNYKNPTWRHCISGSPGRSTPAAPSRSLRRRAGSSGKGSSRRRSSEPDSCIRTASAARTRT